LAAHKMFTWLDPQRKSKTLDLAQKQIEMAIKAVTTLKEAVTASAEGKHTEAKEHLKALFADEVEIDDLRRLVFEELTRQSLSSNYREDLMHIVKRLDVMADQVKDSARNVQTLLGAEVPKEIWDASTRIAETLVKESNLLGSTIEKLSIAPPGVKELAKKVDEQENIVDDEYLKTRALLSKYSGELNFATMLVLRDLLECMEQIADTCADTADYIRVLAIGK